MRERSKVCDHGCQRGFTLVELMISVLIAIFLLGALLTIVQANRRVFGDQSQLALLQDSERMAMTMMADVIQSAGYFPNPHNFTQGALLTPATYGTVTFASGQSLSGTYSATDPGDSIQVRYATASGDGILNCSGLSNTSGAPALYLNVFQVVSGQLVCTVYINGGAGTPYNLVSGATNSTTTLGITHLSVLYGVKTSSTTTGNNVDTYLTATQVTGLSANQFNNWSSVISARVTLTLTNPITGPGQPATVTFQRLINVMNQVGPTQ